MFRRFILTLVIITLMAGCATDEGGDTEGSPFIGGTTGILISFADGAPPDVVYDGGQYPFDIDVILKNKGEYTVPAARANVKITGIYSRDFSNVTLGHNVTDELVKTEKDSEGNIIEGTEYHAEFEGLSYAGILDGNTPFTIKADVCYEYGTTVNSKICIREDLLDPTKEGVCKVTESKTVYNSGAPVQVTSIDEQAVGTNKIAFIFKVEKMGNGNIYRSPYYGEYAPPSQCYEEREHENKVWVKVDAQNNELNSALSCSGLKDNAGFDPSEGTIKLYNGERTVRCTLDLEQAGVSGDFEKVIKINLLYDYKEDISTSLLVKHAAN